MSRISAIDIGTNTILMLIADVDGTGRLTVVRDEHAIARLGKGVDEHRVISRETFERVLQQLAAYKRIHDLEHSQMLFACGTSALRDAANREEFIDFIQGKLGIRITVLNGEQEAEMTYLGGISSFLKAGSKERFAVLDIGGGSTELVTGEGAGAQSKVSLDVGSVRLTERFLKTSPPSAVGLQEARAVVHDHIRQLHAVPVGTRVIGVAGTLTTLAAIDLDLSTFEGDRISGHVLTLPTIESIFDRLKKLNLEELKAIPQILPLRADIILAGVLILVETMKKIGVGQITVSDRGLRYGIALHYGRPSSSPL